MESLMLRPMLPNQDLVTVSVLLTVSVLPEMES